MTVGELVVWLRTQDQGATVIVLKGERARAWEGDSYSWVDFNPAEHSEYVDMRGNPYAKGKPFENDRTLALGFGE